ncbi:uncharacterized protein LOC141525555 isoform X2 [Cotesia typhae]|uniref:uncharacterized protein LOC141525555 isoform X2 n=1 Tax=Cotesia typhae TaxID=2053667 RepID=UPI003D6983B9
MEQSSKNQDCYFYYYSTCTKGDSCHFRHEPSALGIEVMCTYWQQGNCMNEHCNFRHMELKKNRKSIPCYWESQRGGCKKPHCPFLHTLDRPAPSETTINPSKTPGGPKPVTQEWSNRPDGEKFAEASGESSVGHGSSESSNFISGSVVDPIIVRFNEETDNEGNTPSPQKTARAPSPRPLLEFRRQKTYEEERIDEIVEETAAYYSYPVYEPMEEEYVPSRIVPKKQREEKSVDFEVLTLEEIKRRKRAIIEADSASSFDCDTLDDEVSVPAADSTDRPITSSFSPTESRKRKISVEQPSKPIKLRRSSVKIYTVDKEEQPTVIKEEYGPTYAAKDVQMRLCDSTFDGKEKNGKKEEEISFDDPLDDVGDNAEAVDDIMDDIHQLLGET